MYLVVVIILASSVLRIVPLMVEVYGGWECEAHECFLD